MILASCSGMFAIIIGAFGAHALDPHLSEKQSEIFKTAQFYHLTHSILLLILTLTIPLTKPIWHWTLRSVFFGMLLFSGSLYLIAMREIIGFGDLGLFALVTPLGGLGMVLGWGLIVFAIYRGGLNDEIFK